MIEVVREAFLAAQLRGPQDLGYGLGSYSFIERVKFLPSDQFDSGPIAAAAMQLPGGLKVTHYVSATGLHTTLVACERCPLGTQWHPPQEGVVICAGCGRSMRDCAFTNPLLGIAFGRKDALVSLAEERLRLDPLISEIFAEEWREASSRVAQEILDRRENRCRLTP